MNNGMLSKMVLKLLKSKAYLKKNLSYSVIRIILTAAPNSDGDPYSDGEINMTERRLWDWESHNNSEITNITC